MIEVRTSKVDFHVHITADTALRIIDDAAEMGIEAIAILSRVAPVIDTYEAVQYGIEKGVQVFNGVEVVAVLNDRTVELIAIGFDEISPALDSIWGAESNTNRNKLIAQRQIKMFENNGFTFSELSDEEQTRLETVKSGAVNEKAIELCKILVRSGNRENNLLIQELQKEENDLWSLVQEKVQDSEYYKEKPDRVTAKFIYECFFGPGKPGRNLGLTKSEEFIKTIHDGGGVVLYSPEGTYNDKDWETLQKYGVDGIMAWHGNRLGINESEIDIPKYRIVEARKKGLLVLGGSDYDPNKEDWKLGIGQGGLYMSKRRLEDLKKRISRIRNEKEINSTTE